VIDLMRSSAHTQIHRCTHTRTHSHTMTRSPIADVLESAQTDSGGILSVELVAQSPPRSVLPLRVALHGRARHRGLYAVAVRGVSGGMCADAGVCG
jgi:hypothetical protein